MLQNTWYLADADWFTDLPGAPRLDSDDEAVLGQVTQLFNDESYFDPAMTVAATRVMLLAVEHLGGTMTYGVQTHDLTELARLLCGLNLVQAHLTQAVHRIAERVNARAFVGLDEAPAATVRAVTESLSTAGANGEVFAGHLKEAHLALRTVTT
ncbi:hypothetical protein ABZU53_12815 [Micromonospora sp. NPDC005194]|uniref:hypothetical protein n=1 Tax=Micromonospora sp. NPDC005194 TaxID=3156870 RepID=UPI0033AB8538